MALQSILLYFTLCVALIAAVKFIKAALFSPLNVFPGPSLARFTNWWRFFDVHHGHTHITQLQLHRSHGSAIRLGPDLVSLDVPELLPVIYGFDQGFVKSPFYKVSGVRLGRKKLESFTNTRDASWHAEQLRLIKRCYDLGNLLKYEPVFDNVIDRLLHALDARFAKTCGATCDLAQWLQFFAWDVVAEVTFSTSFGFLEKGEDVGGLLLGNKMASRYFGRIGQIPFLDRILVWNPLSRTDVTRKSQSEFCITRINERLKELSCPQTEKSAHKNDFLGQFLDIQTASGGQPNVEQLMIWLSINFVAGTHTTATSMTIILYQLLKNPQYLTRLQSELDSASTDSKSPMPYSTASNLPFLTAVIEEGLRFQPSLRFLLERLVPAEGLILPDGRFIPGGTTVGMNSYVLQRHQDVFGLNADSFDPTRWLQGANEDSETFNARILKMRQCTFTFGGGSRGCRGRQFAWMEMYKVLPALLQTFEISLANPKRNWAVRNDLFLDIQGVDVRFRRK